MGELRVAEGTKHQSKTETTNTKTKLFWQLEKLPVINRSTLIHLLVISLIATDLFTP